ncbi:ABC transporter ATP-binding protein [Simplicispira suum]|uniref:ABC transporter ATP-binding protein n=1 Tax=Simplicispira suum TaxID=2109915 RepID=A0A2S0N3A0_9BURK|nr:ABC transporter ATP-binding protein [Simplicispira suum]AVO42393.1 ABC transporter ATP-binding protein [Simplicispira suum]
MLRLNNVEVVYSDVVLSVRGVSLAVSRGQSVALLGANGAGKSTTLKAISGLIHGQYGKVASGSVEFEGKSLVGMAPDEVVASGVSHVMEGRRVLRHMTVDQNISVGGHRLASKGEMLRRKEWVYELVPQLKDLRSRVSGYLSGGEQQMLLISRSLMSEPKLMLIDEPSLGLAPQMVEAIYTLLSRCRAEGTAMLIVEQNASAVLQVADYGYVMEGGRIVLEGAGEELALNDDVREFYLGVDTSGERKSFREVKHYRRRKRWLG